MHYKTHHKPAFPKADKTFEKKAQVALKFYLFQNN